jgi:hypothetical protein
LPPLQAGLSVGCTVVAVLDAFTGWIAASDNKMLTVGQRNRWLAAQAG